VDSPFVPRAGNDGIMKRRITCVSSLLTVSLSLALLPITWSSEEAAAPTSEAHPPLDIVYTYVNLTDEGWASKFRTTMNGDFVCHASNTEILMSLLSVQKFFAWVHKVHVVVDNQTIPLDFLDPGFQSKIVFVEHSAIMPPRFLPTFNSITVEAFIHRVPGLTEHYLYLNDDMMFAREVKPGHFFNKENLSVVQMHSLSQQVERNGANLLDMSSDVLNSSVPYLYPQYNAAQLFFQTFGYWMKWFDAHSVRVLNKQSQQHTYATLHKALLRTFEHKVRVYQKLALSGDVDFTVLSQYVGIHTGRMQAASPLASRALSSPTQMSLGMSEMVDGIQAHRKLMFSGTFHVVCAQYLYLLSSFEMVQLCFDVKAHWCGDESDACYKFVEYCSFRRTCFSGIDLA
jgi:hypothetical protein